MNVKSLSRIMLILMPAIAIFFSVLIFVRLICAFLYNLTDIVQYHRWYFQETKDSFYSLVTIPTQVADVVKMLITNIKGKEKWKI